MLISRRFRSCLQKFYQCLALLPDIACPQGDDNVAFFHDPSQVLWDQLPVADPGHVLWPWRLTSSASRSAVAPLNRLLAGRVDVGQHQQIGIVKGGHELVEQLVGAAVAVWLEGGHDSPLRPALPGRCQRCLDLGRVMTVVVHHHDPSGLPP